TLTNSPSANCGLIFLARSCLAVTGSSAAVPAYVSGIPHCGQNRSLSGCVVAHDGQTSGWGSELDVVRAIDCKRPNAGVPVRQPYDDPLLPRARPRIGVGR